MYMYIGRMDLQKGYDYLLAALGAVLDRVANDINHKRNT